MHRILLASCLLAVTAIQCSRPSRRTKPPARAELEQLRQKLRGLNFGPEAAEALQDLENLAHRTESPLAVEAWYLLGLHRLDWLLTGILEGNGKRIRDLLAHLGLDTGCCRRRCIRSGVLASSPTCTSSLRGRLVAPFEAIRRIEGPGKLGYAGLAAELVQMADLLVRGRDPAVHHRLLGERDPAGTRARILFACLLATEEPLRPGRNRDLDRWWRASLPLSCRIPPETRPLDLQKALLAGSCSYPL